MLHTSQDGQAAAIDVTPEMIKAGVGYYLAWIGSGDVCEAVTEGEFVEGVFRSMAAKMDHGSQP